MVKLRKWSTLSKAEKLGRKIAFKHTIFFLTIPLCAPFIGFSISALLTSSLHPILLLPFAVIFCVSIIFYLFHRKDGVNRAYDIVAKDFSKTFVEKHLIPDEYCKIRIFKTRDYQDFITGLANEGEAYALLSSKDQLITLYLKLNGADAYRRLDTITKEEFSSYCELL